MNTPRFSAGLTETAIGPGLGFLADLGELMLKARDAGLSEDEQFRMAELFDLATQNTPFVNLFYLRPALDFLFINSMREVASPGHLRRQERKRLTTYGQTSGNVIPRTLNALGIDTPAYVPTAQAIRDAFD